MNPDSLLSPPRGRLSLLGRLLRGVSKTLLGVAAVLGVVLALVWLAGVFHKKVPTNVEASQETGERTGQVVEVRRIRRPRFETAVGSVKPVHEVALASKLLARVVDVRVKAGQLVEAGELLVKLDDADLSARLRQAEAGHQSALAKRDRTAADLERAAKLVQSKVVTQAEYDATVADARSAAAEVERADQAIVETRVLVSYAEIKSPIAGTVVDKRIEIGDTAVPGQVLLTLYDPKNMQMVATVRESLAQKLRVGQQVRAGLESLDHECPATVSEIVPEADVASRSFLVKVTGPCPPGVYSGMFGRLMIPLEDEELLVVPAAAVRRVGQLTTVDVIQEGGRAERRSIQLGRRLGSEDEVLSGLRAGEKVAVQKAELSETLP
jgi:RND family efflux transporter MFP subunit